MPLEVIDIIRRTTDGACPSLCACPSPQDSRRKGGEEGMELCRIFEDAGVAALDVDAGCYENWYWPHPPGYYPPACMLDMAAKAKKAVKKIPVMCVAA